MLQHRGVLCQITSRYGNIPASVPTAQHLSDLGGHIFHLGIGRGGLIQPHLIAAALSGGHRSTEKVFFQMGQGRVPRRLHKLHGTAASRLLRHTHQALPLLQCILEDLRGRPIPQQSDSDALCLGERRKEDPLLRFVKIGEPVKIHILAPQIRRLRQCIPELLHPGAGIPPTRPEASVIGGVQQRHIPQLVPLLARDILHLGIELLGRYLVGVQLIHQGHQLLQKGRPAGRIVKHMQAAAHLLQRHAHGEKLASAVQGEVRQAAHLSQHSAG